jgi:hypothetical protein
MHLHSKMMGKEGGGGWKAERLTFNWIRQLIVQGDKGMNGIIFQSDVMEETCF